MDGNILWKIWTGWGLVGCIRYTLTPLAKGHPDQTENLFASKETQEDEEDADQFQNILGIGNVKTKQSPFQSRKNGSHRNEDTGNYFRGGDTTPPEYHCAIDSSANQRHRAENIKQGCQ